MGFLKEIRALPRQIGSLLRKMGEVQQGLTQVREALGRVEGRQCAALSGADFAASEFQVFSQWGEDGIIQMLLRHVPVARKLFVEFGVQTYVESNTRFLLTHDNWSGLVLEGSEDDVRFIRNDPIYWQRNLKAVHAFVTRENINDLLQTNGVSGEIGLLSIDIDGNDYWVWEAIDAVNPAIVVAEYNSRFGVERAVTVPYDRDFVRSQAHYSCAYYGASLPALVGLGRRKGYAFVGSNSLGSNAFFVRRDLRPETLPELTPRQGYVARQFREARNQDGRLAHLTPEEETALLATLPLVEVQA